MGKVLKCKSTGKVIEIGDRRLTNLGNVVSVTGREEPKHAASTGRVYVKSDNGSFERGFFPSVVDCHFVEASCEEEA